MNNAALDIPDPVFLLSLYDENIREKRVSLYKWQLEYHFKFAEPIDFQHPNRQAICAANGSGKSQYILAPASVFLGMKYKYARSVITSASGNQLDRQTGRKITHLCERVNKIHKAEIWSIKYREFTCLPTGSTIELFATDDPGKAEGYHPHQPGSPFFLGVDEGKSVIEPIYQALLRCNGITHRTDVSSPGQPQGHFYNVFTGGRWWAKQVTYKDCPHISLDEVEEARTLYGESSPVFRSMYLAEFTSVGEQVVLLYENIQRHLRDLPAEFPGELYAGLDLSGGGDENVLSVWRGNTQIGLEFFRFTDTKSTVFHLKNLFRKYGLRPDQVWADDGGIGRAIIDNLPEGINRINFGGRAINNKVYGNRGTELWFNFGRMFANLRPMSDRSLINQLSARYYHQSDATNKMMLESKREARAAGHPSPDRADATVLAFAGRNPLEYENIARESEQKAQSKLPHELVREMTREQLEAAVELYREQHQQTRNEKLVGNWSREQNKRLLSLYETN